MDDRPRSESAERGADLGTDASRSMGPGDARRPLDLEKGASGDLEEIRVPHPGVVSGREGLVPLLVGLLLAAPALATQLLPLLAATVIALGSGAWLLARGRRTLRLRKERRWVQLSSTAALLPEGEGHLAVHTVRDRGNKGDLIRYEVRHERPGHDGEVLARSSAFLGVRAFAERLARFGGWDLVWRPLGEGGEEVRRVSELDLPFSQRLANRAEALVPRPPRRQPGIAEVEEHGEGRFSVRWPFRLLQAIGAGGVFLAVGLLLYVVGIETSLVHVAALGGLGALALGAGAVRRELLVSPQEVEVRSRLFGRIPLGARRLRAKEIESVLVEEGHTGLQLRLAGDRDELVVPCPGGPLEAAWVRYAVERSLVAGALPAAQAVPEARGACPRCLVALKAQGGPLDEHRCVSCRGRYLPSHGAERLVVEELGIPRGLLRQISEVFRGKRLFCPGCGSRMNPVRLKGVDADLCFGCGALWLDEGELGALSQGRYPG